MSRNQQPAMPWWRVPTMWFVVLGPATVVVAGFITLAIAVRGGDRPLPTAAAAKAGTALTPAHQARNHVGTQSR